MLLVSRKRLHSMAKHSIELVDTVKGHLERIWCVKWHPNGKVFATASADKTIRIWQKEGQFCLHLSS